MAEPQTGEWLPGAGMLVWGLALFPWIDVVIRLGGMSVHAPDLLLRGWDELFLAACLASVALAVLRHPGTTAISPQITTTIAVLLLINVISLAVGAVTYKVGFEAIRVLFQPILFGSAALVLLAEPGNRDRFVLALVVSTSVIALLALLQHATGFVSPRWTPKPWSEFFRAVSIFANPNALGGYLAMVLALALAHAGLAENRRARWALAGACVVLGSGLVMTLSRGGRIAAACAAVLVIAGARRRRAWLLGVTMISLLLPLLLTPRDVGDRFWELASAGHYQQSSESGRLAFWSRALTGIADHPLLGTGPGGFGGSVAVRRNVPGATWVDNQYLKLAAETGLAGLAAFLAVLVLLFCTAFRSLSGADDTVTRANTLGACGAILSVAVMCLVADILDDLYVSVLFWTLAGLMLSQSAVGRSR